MNMTNVYGPVTSRRLGASLGLDLVPAKTCNYDCIYCQLGRTASPTDRIAPYVKADIILNELKKKLVSVTRPDYITIAGSGEPTLNSELPEIISKVKEMTDIPVAVLTNGSLLSNPDISNACRTADLVLPSLDAGDQETFKKVNRPFGGLDLMKVVEGLAEFKERYSGTIWLEVMLLEGINSSDESIRRIGKLVEYIKPDEVQLNTVQRPAAEPEARLVRDGRLQEIASLLEPYADVTRKIAKNKEAADFGRYDVNDVVALIGRRPCTGSQIAETFNVNEIEVIKLLSELMEDRRIVAEEVDGATFYRATLDPSDSKKEA